MQQELNEKLKDVNINLAATNFGNSYFRFEDKTFVIKQ